MLQMLRIIAIVFVVIGHINILFYSTFNYNWFNISQWGRTGGVDLFFVISGFMIYYVYRKYFGQPEQAKPFLIKRIVKLFPSYWLTLFLIICSFIVLPEFAEPEAFNVKNILQNIILYPGTPILSVTWSLSFIFFFYLVFSFLIINPKLMAPVITIWLIACCVIYLLPNINSDFILNIQHIELWGGVLIGYIVTNFKPKSGIIPLFLGLSLFIFLWADNIYQFYSIPKVLPYFIASFLVIIGIAWIDLNKETKINKQVSLIADASYSIFIIHAPALQFFVLVINKLKVINYIGLNLSMVLCVVLAVIVGCLFHVMFEKPITNFLKSLLINKKINFKTIKAS